MESGTRKGHVTLTDCWSDNVSSCVVDDNTALRHPQQRLSVASRVDWNHIGKGFVCERQALAKACMSGISGHRPLHRQDQDQARPRRRSNIRQRAG